MSTSHNCAKRAFHGVANAPSSHRLRASSSVAHSASRNFFGIDARSGLALDGGRPQIEEGTLLHDAADEHEIVRCEDDPHLLVDLANRPATAGLAAQRTPRRELPGERVVLLRGSPAHQDAPGRRDHADGCHDVERPGRHRAVAAAVEGSGGRALDVGHVPDLVIGHGSPPPDRNASPQDVSPPRRVLRPSRRLAIARTRVREKRFEASGHVLLRGVVEREPSVVSFGHAITLTVRGSRRFPATRSCGVAPMISASRAGVMPTGGSTTNCVAHPPLPHDTSSEITRAPSGSVTVDAGGRSPSSAIMKR